MLLLVVVTAVVLIPSRKVVDPDLTLLQNSAQIKAGLQNRWRQMLTAFRRHDTDRSGTVTFDQFQQVRQLSWPR